MDVEFLSCDDIAWGDVLSRCSHDVYHRPGWLRASRHCDVGDVMGLYIKDSSNEALYPIVRRPILGGEWDATSSYGYGGPVFAHVNDASFRSSSLKAAISFLKDEGCISWFIRLHPILNSAWVSDRGLVVDHGKTVSIDLQKSEEEHWRETMSGHRGDINKAIRAGVVVRMDKSRDSIDAFIDIYYQTMTLLNASRYYFFSRDYFYDLFDGLGDELLLFVAEEGGDVIGGSLFTASRNSGIMQYHLSGTATEFRHRQPSKLILHAAREWGRANRYLLLHLGGGVGAEEDALFKFKRGFSQNTHVFQSHRIVVNQERYGQLCRNSSCSFDLSGYFPEYRRDFSVGE